MGYENEKGEPIPGQEIYLVDNNIAQKVPKQDFDVSNEDLKKIGLARGRLRGACEGPQNLCYGFVFEEDQTGEEFGPMKDQPTVKFGEELDIVLPVIVQKLPSKLLFDIMKQYRYYYDKADTAPWLGTCASWSSRLQIILSELNRRGIHQYY